MPTSDTSIIALIKEQLLDRLVADCQTLIPVGDTTAAFVVRRGFLQADPTPGISIMVYGNDPFNPGTWEHSLVSVGGKLGLEHEGTPYDLSGGQLWYRRFLVQMKMFWRPTDTRADADIQADVVTSRVERSISEFILDGTSVGPDTFGEYALQAYPVYAETLPAGGERQFIHNSRIKLAVLTQR